MLAFTARKLLTSTDTVEHPIMIVEHGRVLALSSLRHFPPSDREVPSTASLSDFGDNLIAPGYVDLHIHGSAGYDVMDDDALALPTIESLLARHGVTTYFPTTVTASPDATLRALDRLADAIDASGQQSSSNRNKDGRNRAVPLGIHLEGPFISHSRRGVHPPDNLMAPTIALFDQFWQASRGHIRMMTIAPELEGALEVIAEAQQRGVFVSLGHSDADFAATMRGIDAGARHATHTFNAMRPLDHRSPGILGAVLTDPRISADIIVDGVHLDPAIVKLFAQAKGPHQTVLISDATSATGMPDGRYRLGSFEVEVRDGKCMANGKLAGSVLTMDRAVRKLALFAEWDLPLAVAAATSNPARVAGLPSKGSLAVGADADFIVLNAEGEVLRTFIRGVECLR